MLVQLVIAAMTTEPSVTSAPFDEASGNASRKLVETSLSTTRSCGRFGPAMLGSTSLRSNSSETVYWGSSSSVGRQIVCFGISL